METLIRAKYQHNLEFAQFLKSLWDSNASGHALDDYDAVSRRGMGKGAASVAIYQSGSGGGGGAKPSARAGAARRPGASGGSTSCGSTGEARRGR